MLKVIKRKILNLISKSGYRIININPNDRNFLYEDKSDEEVLYLNIGAGSWYLPHWTNFDNPRPDYTKSLGHSKSLKKSNISFDLMSGDAWPIKDNSLNIVFSSHTIEHLNDKYTLELMKQAHKKLKSGGIIRLTCPDMDVLLDAYKRNDKYMFQEKLNRAQPHSIHQDILWAFAAEHCKYIASTPSASDEQIQEDFKSLKQKDFLNKYSDSISTKFVRDYPKDHTTWFNTEKLLEMLKLAGFEEVYKSGFMQSKSPILRDTRFFDNTHPNISVYVEAVK